MEDLTNEQIISIIDFYKECGISEDIYLSKSGVLDLFTLLKFEPEFDENGNRLPTVYEKLGIAPIFKDGKEVPIVFAIKHKVGSINKHTKNSKTFSFVGAKKKDSNKEILISFKKEYFSAMLSGNISEAVRLFDMLDQLTGGKAEKFIGVSFNYIKFYKKMQKQLLMDMFANFLILRILNQKEMLNGEIFKVEKLYKQFLKSEMNKLASFGTTFSMPKLDSITINLGDDVGKKVVTLKQTKPENVAEQNTNTNVVEQKTIQPEERGIKSFIKRKIKLNIGNIKNFFDTKLKAKEIDIESDKNATLSERSDKILENN